MPTRIESGQAVLTDEEIADVLNRRHGTTANNRKNVAAVRWTAEQKLRKALAELAAEELGKDRS